MQASIIIGLIKLILIEAPGAITAIRALLNKDNPTDADYEAAKEQIRKDTYSALVPNSKLEQS